MGSQDAISITVFVSYQLVVKRCKNVVRCASMPGATHMNPSDEHVFPDGLLRCIRIVFLNEQWFMARFAWNRIPKIRDSNIVGLPYKVPSTT